jgi:hypothetical protein
MAEARTYYDYEFSKGLTWGFMREEIGRGIRELYEVPKELPPKVLALIRKLDAVESNQSRSRTLLEKLDAIEGKCLSRYAPPAEPRSVGQATIGPCVLEDRRRQGLTLPGSSAMSSVNPNLFC